MVVEPLLARRRRRAAFEAVAQRMADDAEARAAARHAGESA
jgi:hypothetical protein